MPAARSRARSWSGNSSSAVSGRPTISSGWDFARRWFATWSSAIPSARTCSPAMRRSSCAGRWGAVFASIGSLPAECASGARSWTAGWCGAISASCSRRLQASHSRCRTSVSTSPTAASASRRRSARSGSRWPEAAT